MEGSHYGSMKVLTSVVPRYFQKTLQRRRGKGGNNVQTHKSQNSDFGNA